MNHFENAVEYVTGQFAGGALEVGLSLDKETCALLAAWAADQGYESTLSRRGDRIAIKRPAEP